MFLALNSSPSNGGVGYVCVVLNSCLIEGLLLWWKLLAGSMMFLSPCCVSLSFYICISIFLPLLLISLKRNGRVGASCPPLELVPQCIPENREELVGSGQCVFCQKLRLWDPPSFRKDMQTSLLLWQHQPDWLLLDLVCDTYSIYISSEDFVRQWCWANCCKQLHIDRCDWAGQQPLQPKPVSWHFKNNAIKTSRG